MIPRHFNDIQRAMLNNIKHMKIIDRPYMFMSDFDVEDKLQRLHFRGNGNDIIFNILPNAKEIRIIRLLTLERAYRN